MELYKLRYNLYNYLIDNNTNYILTYNNKIFWRNLFIIFFIIFIIIIIYDYSLINEIIIIFIIINIIIIYYIFKLDNDKITSIINNDYLNKYISNYKVFNSIFIYNYNNNDVKQIIDKEGNDVEQGDQRLQKIYNYYSTSSNISKKFYFNINLYDDIKKYILPVELNINYDNAIKKINTIIKLLIPHTKNIYSVNRLINNLNKLDINNIPEFNYLQNLNRTIILSENTNYKQTLNQLSTNISEIKRIVSDFISYASEISQIFKQHRGSKINLDNVNQYKNYTKKQLQELQKQNNELDINDFNLKNIFFINTSSKIYIYIKKDQNHNEINGIYNLIDDYYNNEKYKEVVFYYNLNPQYYLIDFDQFTKEFKNDKPIQNINKFIVDYFNNQSMNYISSPTTSNQILNNKYFLLFYNTLKEIETNIKYNDNIKHEDLNNYEKDIIKYNNILKYINIYNDKYFDLKKYIFVKPDFHDYLNKTKYDLYKNKPIINDKVDNKTIDEVIKIITNDDSTTTKGYLIDLETINNYYTTKDKNLLNENILGFYNYLLTYYNSNLNLTLENFDCLYKIKEYKIDENIKKTIDDFNLTFYILIICIIIYMTIIMHFFFIEFSRFIL
jgi:hypothetical protein